MECNHEKLRTVGDRVFCSDCGAELPLEFLMAKNSKNSPEKPAEEPKAEKPAPKKRTAKKAD